MALSPSLQQFKSSGVYRLEFDKSQIINIPAETIRLIIGFSKKGPFNTPVFVQDSVFFKSVFGDIDSALERKGSFFHRTVLTCLDRGPVIVLNLLNLTDADKSQFKSISTSASQANSATVSSPVSSFFNKDKFWFTSASTLVDFANNESSQSENAQRLLNVANVGRKTISVIARKSQLLGFDILAKDWFSVGQVPEFMNENDYIIDYMIDLIIVEGDFSNYLNLSIDPVFGPYFDATGLKKTYIDQFGFERDGLESFLALPNVNVLGVYSGALIPEFQDKNGENLFIEDLINLETSKTGLLLGFDKEKLDDEPGLISGDLIDLVGHTIESEEPAILDFLSYYGAIIDTFDYSKSIGTTAGILSLVVAATAGQTGANALLTASAGITGATGWSATAGYYDTLLVYGPNATLPAGYASAFSTTIDFESFRSEVAPGKTFIPSLTVGATAYANYTKVTDESYNSDTDILTLKISLSVDAGITGPTSTNISYYRIDNGGVTASGGTASLAVIKSLKQLFSDGIDAYVFVNNDLYQDNLSGIITDGDRMGLTGGTGATAFGYVDFTRFSETNFSTSTPIGSTCNNASAFGATQPIFGSYINYLKVNAYSDEDLTTSVSIGDQTSFKVKTLTENINETLEVYGTYTNPVTTVWFDNSATGPFGDGGFTGRIKVGDYLTQNFGGTGAISELDPETGKSRLTRVITVSEDTNPTSDTYKKVKVITNDAIYIFPSAGVYQVERYRSVENFVSHYHIHTLSGYTLREEQMPNGTIDRQNEILDVMYDTNIAAALEDREVITFRYIVDSFEGGIEPASKVRLSRLAKRQQSSLAIVNMPSVKQFRDSTNPLFKFSSSDAFDPAYIASGGNLALNPTNIFSLPGIADGSNYSAFYGPNLNIRENGTNKSIPPAAHVSNLYIDKYNLALPYSIVAGPRRGVVTGQGIVGVEYAFDRTDLDSIEPFGYNAILNKRGFGLVINANQTAQQNVKSALSQIHVRELLIYIQDGIEAILKNYRWEFNTAQNRLEIKTLADNFLTQILSDGGVYDFQNIMDTTNNTVEVIDNNIGILDTYIEPVRGMGILVHRTTILKTGAISTGNFI